MVEKESRPRRLTPAAMQKPREATQTRDESVVVRRAPALEKSARESVRSPGSQSGERSHRR